jgi:WD40 repeat protein
VAPYQETLQLWRLSDGQQIATLFTEDDDYAAYKSLAFSPDGRFLATGKFEAGEVWLWQVSQPQLLQQLEPSGGRVQGLAFSPDGHLLVCGKGGGSLRDKEMRVWDMHTRKATQGFLKKNWYPTFSPDGKLLASVDTHFFTLWDVATRRELRRFPTPGHITRITFSPGGRLLVFIIDREPTIYWWKVENGQEIYRMSS